MENELLDILRKRQKDAEDEGMVAAVASGLGSVLMGDVGGDVAGYGADLVGGRMKRKEALQDQESNILLAELKAKQGGTSTPYTFDKYQDAQGSIRIGRGHKGTGEFITRPDDRIAGFAPMLTTSKESDRIVRGVRGQAGAPVVPVKEIGSPLAASGFKITPKRQTFFQEKRLPKIEAMLKADNESLRDAALAAKNIAEDGSFPNIQALKSLLKTTDPRISNEDFTIARDNLSKVQSIVERAKQLKLTRLEPRLRGEVIRVIANTYDVIEKHIQKKIEAEIKSQSLDSGEAEYYKTILGPAQQRYGIPKGFGKIQTKNIGGKPVQFFFDGTKWQEL